jgi:hypothetical protein
MPTTLEVNEIAKTEFGLDDDLNEVSIADKYSELRDIVVSNFDKRVWFLMETALCVHVSCILEDIANPLALIFIDGPSTEKTTILDFFDGLPMSHRIDKFTPASFLTQSANVKQKDLKKVDLLPRIAYKTMLIPEMGPTFNQPKEILLENYALIARVLDGNGLVTSGGIHGVRKLEGDYIFGLLGASTPLSQTAWNTMGKVGSRLIFLHVPARLNRNRRLLRARDIMTAELHYKTRKKIVKDAVRDFLTFFFSRYKLSNYEPPDNAPDHLRTKNDILNHCQYYPRVIHWERSKDVDEAIDTLALCAEFLTACRSDVKTWTERGEDGHRETNSTGVVTEGVDRFASVIYNLARCHALISGRDYVNQDDLPLAMAVTLSSLPDDRRRALELLIDDSIDHKKTPLGEFDIYELMKMSSCCEKTARLQMDKLEILGIGTIESSVGSKTIFRLHADYGWFTTDAFKQYYRLWERKN